MSDALRQDTTYEYDGEGLKTAETDRRGVKRRFTYDNLGRPLRTELLASISAVPWTQEVEYHDQDRKRIETDARGQKTTYDLDKLGRVVSITDPDTKPKTLAYDGVNKVAESDKRGHVTRFKYDAVNRLVEVIDPPPFQLQTVTTTYDDVANRVTEKDRRGKLRVTQLDPLGRTRSVTRAGVILERHEYDGNGNRTRSLDAENRETRFAYDPANRLAARTDGYGTPAAATTTFKYDPSSNPTEERDARATALGEPFSVRRTYDELNRLTSMVDGEAHVTRYSYDPEGNKTLETEPKGQKTAYEYDEQGKLTKVIQPEVDVAGGGTSSPVTRHVYDPARNHIRQTDANGHVVEMAYDKLNRLTTMTQDPGGLNLVTEHEYDANGNETKLDDPKGQTVTTHLRRAGPFEDEGLRLRAERSLSALAPHHGHGPHLRPQLQPGPDRRGGGQRHRPARDPGSDLDHPPSARRPRSPDQRDDAAPGWRHETGRLHLLRKRHSQDRHRPRKPGHRLRLRRPEPAADRHHRIRHPQTRRSPATATSPTTS